MMVYSEKTLVNREWKIPRPSGTGFPRPSSSSSEGKLEILLDIEDVGGLLGPEELATSAAGSGAAAADEDEKHEACNKIAVLNAKHSLSLNVIKTQIVANFSRDFFDLERVESTLYCGRCARSTNYKVMALAGFFSQQRNQVEKKLPLKSSSGPRLLLMSQVL